MFVVSSSVTVSLVTRIFLQCLLGEASRIGSILNYSILTHYEASMRLHVYLLTYLHSITVSTLLSHVRPAHTSSSLLTTDLLIIPSFTYSSLGQKQKRTA